MWSQLERVVLRLAPGTGLAAREVDGTEALRCEWLEADGLGGFASGTALGIRTRRYHSALLVANAPPADRFVLAQGFEAWVDTDAGTWSLSSNVYEGDVLHPDGIAWLRAFELDPWPRWRYELPDGTRIVAELFVPRGSPLVVATWTREAGRGGAWLRVRPLFGPRDFHGTHHVNDTISHGVALEDRRVIWELYDGVPAIAALATGSYEHAPEWFHNVLYVEERERGLDDREDVFSPGELSFELGREPVGLVLGTADALAEVAGSSSAHELIGRLGAEERARRSDDPLQRARDAYLVRGASGPGIIAGYPWFGEWGRDTFIAMRGLCLACDRLDEAAALLEDWAGAVSEGMLPNRFPDHGSVAEYNSVDASLWFGVVACELIEACERADRPLSAERRDALLAAIDAIVAGFVAGTRHRIHVDEDGLVAAGEPGVQLTWMDAKVGDWVVTPRIGKPVEVQALWLNLLALASKHRPALAAMYERGRAAFVRFFCEERGHLYDVIDVDHERGRCDASLRPNQIYAVGGLPVQLVEGEQARAIVETVEHTLLTPIGLRTLAPYEHGYVGHYGGGVLQRDGAYHQGTVWPHLLGPFVEAWLRVHGNDAKHDARARFLEPLRHHLTHAGLGHVSEIADADPPHTPRGTPFQAWGIGELIRIERMLHDE